LAFSFDGTGYGDDGGLWGGEVFVANTKSYERIYHFEEISLLGGEVAIREPRRIGLSLLFDLFDFDRLLQMQIPLVKTFSKRELQSLYQMHKRGINAPKSSSVGRLFDALYALSGFLEPLEYEGESGMVLECLATNSYTEDSFTYILQDKTICYKEMIVEILEEKSVEDIARKFINTLVKIVVEISDNYPSLQIVLTGGVFQNRVLLQAVTEALKMRERKYYIQQNTPLNDGGISLGQAYYAIKNLEG